MSNLINNIIYVSKIEFEKKYELLDSILLIYDLLINYKNINLSEISLSICYNNVQISEFSLLYEDGLILHNENNNLRIVSVFPQVYILDSILLRLFEKGNKCLKPKDKKDLLAMKKKNKKICRSSKECTTITNTNNDSKIHKLSDTKCNNECCIDKEIHFKLDNIKLDKLKNFKQDKELYFCIKNDIDNGTFMYDEIHPQFTDKYQLFRILENRNVLNCESNDNINYEYELFKSLYDEIIEDEPIDDIKENVFIPHNYEYMSNDKKEEYAKKYKLTRQEFEDKYFNHTDNNDNIEKNINLSKI